ncbi:MAG: cupin domain-containing protein, partial [Candidatus Omnitrophota bacterium]
MANQREQSSTNLTEMIDLQKSVEYQAGNVVSRTILNKPTGTLTVFAFDQGQGLSEHTAPFDATILILDGQARITIDGKPHRLEAGQLIVMPANHPHAVHAEQRFK